VPALLVLNRLVFAFRKPQVEVPFHYGCLGYPTPIPVLTERYKAFCELNPFTAAGAHNALVLTMPVNLTVK
jgi:hypothetical protein